MIMILKNLKSGRSSIAILEKYKNNPLIHLHYSNHKTLGLNPKTESHPPTPLGVYTYPLKYYWNTIKDKKIPTGTNRPYILVLKMSKNINYINDFEKNYTNKMFGKDIDKLLKLYTNVLEEKNLKEAIIYGVRNTNPKNAANTFWTVTKYVAKEFNSNIAITWNKVLRELGYDGFGDLGSGIIHPKEPIQSVFLHLKAIKLIKVLDNN